MPALDDAEPITDLEQARQADLSHRLLRSVLWLCAVYWVAIAALVKLVADIPLVAAAVLGVLGVVGTVVWERLLWHRNRMRLSRVVDPVTGELPGGRLPMPVQLRLWFPVSAVVVVAVVAFLAATH